jgi:NTE family protein
MIRTTVTQAPPVIGLALGSGAARGWAHIGVLRILEREGISPSIVCGTSIGALVGAAYAAGQVERMHDWVKTLDWQAVMSLMDLKMGGGLIEGSKLVDFFSQHFKDEGIERLEKKFACVATDLSDGNEIWLREGKVIDAVRASIALPGLFTPIFREGRLLVDGGLVNPIPVSLCRAMGAEIVIAVDLNWNLVGRRSRISGDEATKVTQTAQPSHQQNTQEQSSTSLTNSIVEAIMSKFRPSSWSPPSMANSSDLPSMLDVLATSLNIMQLQISENRLNNEPADLIIRPDLSGTAAMDFHRGTEAIKAGEQAARNMLPAIKKLLPSNL